MPEIEVVAETKVVNKHAYSAEQKVKRYHSILRDFMTYYHQRSETYPSDYQFTEMELRAVHPKAIGKFVRMLCALFLLISVSICAVVCLLYAVEWMNFKMFGTIDPDFSGETKLSGSHHTIAFYRKGIGHFMPDGNDDWDPMQNTGNPTRSKLVRDLIKKVKDLTDTGDLSPRKTKRNSDVADGSQTKKAAKSRKKARTSEVSTISVVPNEVNTLLRSMHAEKTRLLRGLDDLGNAVQKMKADVEMSYGSIISNFSKIGSSLASVARDADQSEVMLVDSPAAVFRTRNLFTQWSVKGTKLTPLADNWSFPTNLTAKEALKFWFMGDSSSHTPPLKYLTVAHMKHVKGSTDGFNKVRKFMKIVQYLGVKNGYWCENWDSDRISTLWAKIEDQVGVSTNDATRPGDTSIRTILSSLSKQNPSITTEMVENAKIILDEARIAAVVQSTEEASLAARGGAAGDDVVSPENLELLWGIHHGKLNPLPADWEFPIQSSILEALHLWLVGDVEKKIPPFVYIQSRDVSHIKSGSGYLSKLRCVMKVITHHGAQLNVWCEEWDNEKIKTLWYTVWDANAGKSVFEFV